MKPIQFIFILFVICLFNSCDDNNIITEQDYPRLNTMAVSDISTNGAIFNAEFLYRGDFEILSYGFVWKKKGASIPNFDNAEKVVYTKNVLTDCFYDNIPTTLKANKDYYVRAFVTTNAYTVYGDTVSFHSLGSSAPTIDAIVPSEGYSGDIISIKGGRFSYYKNEVYFDNQEAKIYTKNDTIIRVYIPETITSEYPQITVSIADYTSEPYENFHLKN